MTRKGAPPLRVLSMSRPAALGARLKHIKDLVEGLARAQGAASPAAEDLANEINRDLDAVQRALRTNRRGSVDRPRGRTH